MRYARVTAVALLIALLTWVIGWWAVPLVSFGAGLLWRAESGRAGTVALGAAIGWAVLLLIDAAQPRFLALAAVLGGVVHAPGILMIAMTLAFAALLAWSAASVAAVTGRPTTTHRTTGDTANSNSL